MALNLNYKGVAVGGLHGFLVGTALVVLSQVSGLTTAANLVPVSAFIPLFTFLGAVAEGLEKKKE